jgi:hypothetical protein
VTFNHDADRERDEELLAAARSLHKEWESRHLWPRIAAAMREHDQTAAAGLLPSPSPIATWWQVAAAALVVVALGSTAWLGWRSFTSEPAPNVAARDRLLNEEALAAIEQSEAQYVRAIDELTRLAAPRLEMPDSPLLVNLRERLTIIDMAIAECRSEIDRNRFNAHLRRQLLWMYQEKRRTLEQIQEYDPNAL